jgi:sugar/nucleoside kinase (ribokinase family)
MSLLVVGSVALDDIEAPAGTATAVLGGAACYFAVAASYFVPVRAVGVVGGDFDAAHLEFLASRGVDTSGIYTADGPTFRWGGRYHESMNRRDTLFTELGVFDGFDPKLSDIHRDSRYVFLANIHPDLQLSVLDQANAPVFCAMDTMNFWIEGTPEELRKILARVNGLVINDEEALQLTGATNVIGAAEAIRELGPRVVVVKRGEYGALLFDDTGIFAAPAFPLRDVLDPTGAGDSFAGGFMGEIARSGATDPDTLRRAVIAGSVLASFCCEAFGLDRFRSLEAPEIAARTDDFRSLTRF